MTDSARTPVTTPLGWSIVMLGLLVLYLIPELIFNAKLVAIAGGRESDNDTLRSIELFGRAMSGIGVSLLLADAWIRGRRARGIWRPLVWLGLCLLLVWPLVFFGQKWLVDRWLVDPSSAEQRQRAVVSQLLRASLADSTIAIEGLPSNSEAPPSPAEMTFLTVFGVLAYADPELIRQVEAQRELIARQLVQNRAYRDFERHYQDYQALRDQVRERYQRYLEHYDIYTQELNASGERAGELWEQAEQRVHQGWEEYQQGVARLNRRAQELAEDMGPQLYEYFERRSQCGNDRCRERLDQRYEHQMQRTAFGYVPPSHWLIETEVSTTRNLLNTGVMAAFTGGVSLLAQGVDRVAGGDGGWRDKNYHYINDPEHYRQRVRQLLEPEFVEQSQYPSTIESFAEFQAHEVTGHKVVRWGAEQGLRLPEGWGFAQRDLFDQAARQAVREEIRRRWDQQSDGIAPGLSWDAFQQHTSVQRQIQRAMGDYYVSGIRADWNNLQFKQGVLDPMVEREARRLVEEVQAQAETFEDGGTNEAVAKRALRATLVPPISMTLSLALVLATMVKIPFKAWSLWQEHRRREPRLTPVRALALRGIVLVGILVFPALLGSVFLANPYVEQNRATRYFLTQVEANNHPVTSLTLGWALRAQPVLLPVGLGLEDRFGVYQHFERLKPRLQGWDDSLQEVARRY